MTSATSLSSRVVPTSDVRGVLVTATQGSMLVLVNQRRARFFEHAPEGIVERPEIVIAPDTWHHERNLSEHGSTPGPRGPGDRLVDAGSHLDAHRQERQRQHMRRVAERLRDHLAAHPEAGLYVAGPVRDRATLLGELPPALPERAVVVNLPVADPAARIAQRFHDLLAVTS